MPWKPIKGPTLRLPTRQEIIIIAATIVLALLTIAYFALRS
jgi:hypothetical protein